VAWDLSIADAACWWLMAHRALLDAMRLLLLHS
jgi:hypothetical protein